MREIRPFVSYFSLALQYHNPLHNPLRTPDKAGFHVRTPSCALVAGHTRRSSSSSLSRGFQLSTRWSLCCGVVLWVCRGGGGVWLTGVFSTLVSGCGGDGYGGAWMVTVRMVRIRDESVGSMSADQLIVGRWKVNDGRVVNAE